MMEPGGLHMRTIGVADGLFHAHVILVPAGVATPVANRDTLGDSFGVVGVVLPCSDEPPKVLQPPRFFCKRPPKQRFV
jgi:hypothetical protein